MTFPRKTNYNAFSTSDDVVFGVFHHDQFRLCTDKRMMSNFLRNLTATNRRQFFFLLSKTKTENAISLRNNSVKYVVC